MPPESRHLTLNDYQIIAMRTDDPKKYDNALQQLLNGLMGLNGEAGEAIDILKKSMFQGHDLIIDDVVEELGDTLWYIALCATALNVSLEDIALMNCTKLMKRYPEGFTEAASIERKDHDENGEPVVPEVLNEP